VLPVMYRDPWPMWPSRMEPAVKLHKLLRTRSDLANLVQRFSIHFNSFWNLEEPYPYRPLSLVLPNCKELWIIASDSCNPQREIRTIDMDTALSWVTRWPSLRTLKLSRLGSTGPRSDIDRPGPPGFGIPNALDTFHIQQSDIRSDLWSWLSPWVRHLSLDALRLADDESFASIARVAPQLQSLRFLKLNGPWHTPNGAILPRRPHDETPYHFLLSCTFPKLEELKFDPGTFVHAFNLR
jgi:hypothetical protein